jgi:DNA replication licensing factor MCM2
MSDNSDDDTPSRKRRRTIADEDEDDDDDNEDVGSNANAGNDDNDDEDAPPPAAAEVEQEDPPGNNNDRASRAALLERRSSERRRRRQQEEARHEAQELQIDQEIFEPIDNDNNENPPTTDDEQDNDVDDVYAHDPNNSDNDNNNNGDEEEEEDGEDLLENAERDYQRIDALDTYGTEGIDDRDFGQMDLETRRQVEAELAVRDRQSSRNAGLYGAALDVLETEEDDEARRARRGVFRIEDEADKDDLLDDETDEEDLDGDDQINIEAFDVPLREWIAQDRTRREIQRKFRAFLRHFTPEHGGDRSRRKANGMYEQKIKSMCASNGSTLQISYLHLMEFEPVLAVWLTDAPRDMLDVLNEAASRHTLMLFSSYNAIKSEIHVRISEVPILDSLRDLRRSHLDCLVKVHGVVTRRSTVYPQLQLAHYICMSCKAVQGPFRIEGVGQNLAEAYMPDECPNCEQGSSFKLHPTLSQYRNFQRVNLQETPGSVPPGRVPRTKEVLLINDLIDIARPGEEVEVTGIYEHTYDSNLTLKSGFPVFSTFLTANHVRKREDASSASNMSESDVRRILELSRDPKIAERIVASIAPSIFGHDNCKMALAMSLFGGVPKNINDKHRIRGDCNVLLLGDPGTAKSQLLKYAQNTAPRAVYSTGKGASAVGLTASVHKDPITKEWTLEGGALVLADKGVALIDEFDKSKYTET